MDRRSQKYTLHWGAKPPWPMVLLPVPPNNTRSVYTRGLLFKIIRARRCGSYRTLSCCRIMSRPFRGVLCPPSKVSGGVSYSVPTSSRGETRMLNGAIAQVVKGLSVAGGHIDRTEWQGLSDGVFFTKHTTAFCQPSLAEPESFIEINPERMMYHRWCSRSPSTATGEEV